MLWENLVLEWSAGRGKECFFVEKKRAFLLLLEKMERRQKREERCREKEGKGARCVERKRTGGVGC